jgi:hypothetical protein
MRAQAVEKHVALIGAIRARETRRRHLGGLWRQLRARVETRCQRAARAGLRGGQQVVEHGDVNGEHGRRAVNARPLHVMQQHAERTHLAQHHEHDQQRDIAREKRARQRPAQQRVGHHSTSAASM